MKEYDLAKYINTLEPLNKFRIVEDIKNNILELSIEQRINLLVFSFENYDKGFNEGLCLTYPKLWNEFAENDWKKLIIKMFPRKVKFIENDLREINTGAYFDVFLLNGIIGVSPFDFIFNELKIEKAEKKSFLKYLKFYGEFLFFYDARKLIEDIVNFYELDVFSNIVNMKESLISGKSFGESMTYYELLNKFDDLEL